jgi:hypothetical protein
MRTLEVLVLLGFMLPPLLAIVMGFGWSWVMEKKCLAWWASCALLALALGFFVGAASWLAVVLTVFSILSILSSFIYLPAVQAGGEMLGLAAPLTFPANTALGGVAAVVGYRVWQRPRQTSPKPDGQQAKSTSG